MRAVSKLLVVLGIVVASVWIGGEMLLARKAAALIAADPLMAAASVRELREPRRVGLRVDQLSLATAEGDVALPWLELWVPPLRPNEVHATLPPEAEVVIRGNPVTLTSAGAAVSARFSPAHGFALSRARIRAERVALDGQPLAERLDLQMQLSGFGADAPRAAGAAYDITADIARLMLAPLTAGMPSDAAGLSGRGRLWLDRAPARGGSTTPPRLVGLRMDGMEVRLGDLRAHVWGRVVAAADGRAEGELLVDTADAEAFVARAAEWGLLPPATVPLAAALLAGLAATPATQPDGADAAAAAARVPPKPAGQLRIPLGFRAGKLWLGPVPLGAAPVFPV